MPELSVEEIARLARKYLAGDPTVEEAQRLNMALQDDPQASLELLTRMQEALDQAQPGGMSPADWQEVDASVEALIREKASHSSGPLMRLKVWLLKHSRKAKAAAAAPSRPAARTLAILAGAALALALVLALAYAMVARGGLKRLQGLHLHLPHLGAAASPAQPAAAPAPSPAKPGAALAAPAPALAPVAPAPAIARAQPVPSPLPLAAKPGTAVRAEQLPSSAELPSELPPVTPMPSGKLDIEQEP